MNLTVKTVNVIVIDWNRPLCFVNDIGPEWGKPTLVHIEIIPDVDFGPDFGGKWMPSEYERISAKVAFSGIAPNFVKYYMNYHLDGQVYGHANSQYSRFALKNTPETG